MIAAMILAAGYSRRFGTDKRLYRRTSEMPPMLVETVSKYTQAFDPCFVVIRDHDDAVEQLLRAHFGHQVRVITSQDAVFGMGASLANGAQHIIAEHTGLHALFIGHGDMPFVDESSLARLHRTMEGLSPCVAPVILRPRFKGVPGHPVGFARMFVNELAQLSGDVGARPVLASHPDAVQTIEIDDPGVCLDLDTS